MNQLSIIEQAARRLEELKRVGVEIPIPPQSSGPPIRPGLSSTTASRAPEARLSHESTAEQLRTPRAAAGNRGKRSAVVEIDLDRLARMAYLIPGQAATPLASELRLIKRPLLRNIDRTTKDSRSSLIMITSAIAGEGKTFCSVNLAMSMAMEVDTTVLLVDADVVRPAVLERLGLPTAPGLLDVLSRDVADVSDVLLKTNIPKLSILPAGAPRSMSTELLASDAMGDLLIDLANRYSDRVILLDAPPLLVATESPVLASHVGQVVLVVDSLGTSRQKVAQALATVESCPIVLPLLNRCRNSQGRDGYGYSYGYR